MSLSNQIVHSRDQVLTALSQQDAGTGAFCIESSQNEPPLHSGTWISTHDAGQCGKKAHEQRPAYPDRRRHRQIPDAASKYLESNGFRATTAADARELDAMLRSGRFDLIVLDVMMPGGDALSVCCRLSAEGVAPILMLIALSEDTDRIVGLEVGADDYFPKPFNRRKLLARIKAILRRVGRHTNRPDAPTGHTVQFAGWTLDTESRRLPHADGREEVPDQSYRIGICVA